VGGFGDPPTGVNVEAFGEKMRCKTYDGPLKALPYGNTKPGHSKFGGIIVWRRNRRSRPAS